MSEDSLASDIISCRKNEACAPLLPPRKRLLAGLKHNGWSSPSSSSCAAASMDDIQVSEILGRHAAAEQDQDYVEAEDRASSWFLPNANTDGVCSRSLPNADAESMDSPRRCQRQSKRLDNSSMKKYSKRNKHSSGLKGVSEKDSGAMPLFVTSSDVKGSSVSEAAKVEEGMDVFAGEAESGQGSINASVNVKEAQGGAESTVPSVDPKLVSSPSAKEEANHECEELYETSRETTVMGKGEEETVALKPRRNPNRQLQSRSKAVHHKQNKRHNMSSHTPLPIDDEEFARQLHRAINSSPRISRCQSIKENGSTQKHLQGGAKNGQQSVNVSVNAKEVEGEANSTVFSVDPKPVSSPSVKEAGNHGCEELCKSTREPARMSKGDEGYVGLTTGRNPKRQHHSSNKVVQHKQNGRHNMRSCTPLPLDDEEFARQLHRAINNSSRISRCQGLKENGTTASRNPKHD